MKWVKKEPKKHTEPEDVDDNENKLESDYDDSDGSYHSNPGAEATGMMAEDPLL